MRAAVNPARWLSTERLLAVQPAPQDALSAGFRRRIKAFSGRSLSHLALTAEQEQRAGRIALRGQSLSAGVITGLEVSVDRAARKTLRIAPGYGIAATGEDVELARELDVPATDLLVSGSRDESGVTLLLREMPARARVLVLVLQPIELLAREGGDETNPCENDPAADAFVDHQRVDGALPIWVELPDSLEAIAHGTTDPTMRNRLAHAIFQREVDAPKTDADVRAGRKLTFPWEEVGVPLALVGLDAAGNVTFVDRHAVLRRGGKAKRRSALLLERGPYQLFTGQPALWQARVDQHGAHVVDLLVDQVASPSSAFAFAPPAGLLPLDFLRDLPDLAPKQSFFPSRATIEWMPIPLEQLDAELAASAPLARIDLARHFTVRMLVPVPGALYEPRLLVREQPNQKLLDERDRLALALRQRRYVRDAVLEQRRALEAGLAGDAAQAPVPPPVPEETLHDDDPVPSVPPTFSVPDELELFLATAGKVVGGPERERLVKLRTVSGMRGVRAELARLADKTDDTIDFHFLRVQADLYRARQVFLGDETTTKLAVAPALANITKGATYKATSMDLQALFAKMARSAPAAVDAVAPVASGAVFVERSVKITAEPLARSPFDEVRAGSSESKYGAFGAVASLSESWLDDVRVSVPEIDEAGRPTGKVQQVQLGSIKDNVTKLKDFEIDVRDDQASDEAQLLKAQVRQADETISLLRQIERKVASLRDLVARADALLKKLASELDVIASRLVTAEKDLAEARHDHSVALALVAEDAASVAATNARRSQVLRDHVKITAFVRPRTEDLLDDSPSRDLESPEEQPVLACFHEPLGTVPTEIRQAVDLVRRAPLRWFPPHLPLLEAIDDRASLVQMVKTTVELAPLTLIAKPAAEVQAEARPIVDGLKTGVSAMEAQLVERDDALRAFDVGRADQLAWAALRDEASRFVSAADLAHIGHVRPDILQKASSLIDGITRVATCLYRRFAEVAPDIRLAWVERLSVFDSAVGLRDLMVLPRFLEIAADDRGAMQALVDWLFSQIAQLPRPQAMMHNLVRVCALLASHAPVKQLLRGKIGKVTVSIGHVVRIDSLDLDRTRVGMTVLIGKSGLARAVIDDIAPGFATAKIVATTAASVDIPESTEALVGEPEPIAAAAAKVTAPAK